MKTITLFAASLLFLNTFADPVDDVKAGTDLWFDVKGMTYTATGAYQDSGVVTDEDTPPACMPKNPGTLDIVFDFGPLGYDFMVVFTGVKASPNKIIWTTDTIVNKCITIYVDGQPLDVLIKKVTGKITADVQEMPAAFASLCGRTYNAFMQDIGGNTDNWIDIEAYAFCVESIFTKINVKLRDFEYEAMGGVGRCLPFDLSVLRGTSQSGNLDSLKYSDDNKLVIKKDRTFNVSGSLIMLDVFLHVPNYTPEEMKITIESMSSITGAEQMIRAYNFTTGVFDTLDTRVAAATDSATEIILDASQAHKYINPNNGTARLRIQYTKTGLVPSNWTIALDQVIILVTP